MDLISMFSDDQVAVIGGLVALSVCVLIAMLSYRLGPAGRDTDNSQKNTIPVPQSRIRDTAKPQDRRAA